MNRSQHLTDVDPLVSVNSMTFSYSDAPLYEGLGLSIPRGAVTVIMGPSGCGKSTLLALIGGRLSARRGTIMVDGVEVGALSKPALYSLRRRMGMLFQFNALLSELNVFENVAFPVREHTNLPETLLQRLVKMKLEMVGLRGASHLMPSELSGGMARRVALARAIALDPVLVMYDEPFTGLDPISKGVIVQLIRQLNDALGMSSIVVTQDVAEGLSIADYVFVFAGGDIIVQGTPQEVNASTQPDARQFLDGLPDGPVPYHYASTDYHDDLLADGN